MEFFLFINSIFLVIVIIQLINQEEHMNELQAAQARNQASINAAIAKIQLLHSNQGDPAAIQAVTDALNSSSDALDASVAAN